MFYLNQKNKVKVDLNKIGKATLQKALGEINKIINHNEIKKPKFWDYKHNSILSYLLWPLSKIVEKVSNSNKKNRKKITGIKSICVGNIYIGGTGKTSLAIEIKKY